MSGEYVRLENEAAKRFLGSLMESAKKHGDIPLVHAVGLIEGFSHGQMEGGKTVINSDIIYNALQATDLLSTHEKSDLEQKIVAELMQAARGNGVAVAPKGGPVGERHA